MAAIVEPQAHSKLDSSYMLLVVEMTEALLLRMTMLLKEPHTSNRMTGTEGKSQGQEVRTLVAISDFREMKEDCVHLGPTVQSSRQANVDSVQIVSSSMICAST